MPKVTVLDMAGKEVSKIDLSDAVFGIEPNKAVMHDMVKNYLANQRQGTQSAHNPRLRFLVVVKNLGDKKVQVMLDKVLQELLNGHMAVLYLLQSHAATDIL